MGKINLSRLVELSNAISTPLLSSLILITHYMEEEVDNIECYGKMLQIDHQIMAATAFLLELKEIIMNQLHSELILDKAYEEKNIKEKIKEFVIGILIVIEIGYGILILNNSIKMV